MLRVSVPEARRLMRLAATPMTAAARQLGNTWSQWRREHQARAYQAAFDDLAMQAHLAA